MIMQRTLNMLKVLLPLLAIIVLAGATYSRNAVWQNDLLFLEDEVRKSPNKGRPHHNLGREYDKRGWPGKGLEQYLMATRLDPYLARAHESLGISYVSFNRPDLARHELETALRLDPSLNDARLFLNYITKQGK